MVCLLKRMASEKISPRNKLTTVEVRTPARLHLGMLSFGVPAVRSFGGIGVMVDRPGVQIRLKRADQFVARGPLAERTIEFAKRAARAWNLTEKAACAIEVLATPRAHVGLGSGTQMALAVAAGMRRLFISADGASAEEHGSEIHPTDNEWLFDTPDALDLPNAVRSIWWERVCI